MRQCVCMRDNFLQSGKRSFKLVIEDLHLIAIVKGNTELKAYTITINNKNYTLSWVSHAQEKEG